MKICITIILMNVLYLTLVSVFYFKKQRLNNYENKLYAILLKLCLIGLPLELACCFFVYYKDLTPTFNLINVVVCKTFLIYMLAWLFTFTTYILTLSFGKREKYSDRINKNKRKIVGIILIIFGIVSLLAINLPLYYNNTGGYIYSFGPAADVVTVFGAISIIIDVISLFLNLKIISIKKYSPLFVFVFLMIVACILREVNPGITVINSMFAFITILMFYTIENPDMLMVNELLKNREIVENAFQEKSNILFKVSQEVKEPANNINQHVYDFIGSHNEYENNESLLKIEKNARDILYIVNDVLDISTMDVNNSKLIKSNYNLYPFFLDIKSKTETNLHETQKLVFNVSDGLPKKIIGDSLKLKQALMSFIFNAIKFTDEGLIEINVSGFTRYDVCRLIISIKDSGRGMSLELINKILSKTSADIEDAELDYNKMDVKLEGAIKFIKLLGGIVNIKSDIGRGTEIVITLDQKTESEHIDDLPFSGINREKKVLLVSDDSKELNELKTELSKYDVSVTTSMMAEDCLFRIKSQEVYDLLLIKDDLRPIEALPLLNKLKEIEGFNSPVVVLLNKNKTMIKEHYLNDGFSDYILNDSLSSDLKRVIGKFL